MERNKLEQQVLSEAELLTMLGLTKKQLNYLRWQKDFPCVQLHRTVRVYVADDVFDYIERRARDAAYDRHSRRQQKVVKADAK